MLPRVGPAEAEWGVAVACRLHPAAAHAAEAVSARRRVLLGIEDTLTFIDFGAGHPKEGTVGQRRLADLAGAAGTDPRKALWLHALVAQAIQGRSEEADPVRILEVGTSLGLGALAMLNGQETALQYTGLEGSPEVAQWAQNTVAPWEGQIVVGPFERTLPAVLGSKERWDVVFLDGHHEGAALFDQWHRIRPHLHSGAVVIVDDIRWSLDMHAAWMELAEQPDMVALDLFRMGVLTFSKGGNAPIQRVPTRLLA